MSADGAPRAFEVGDEVVEVPNGYRPSGFSPSPVETTVARLTKTQVVLANGNRLRLRGASAQRRQGGTYGTTFYLRHADDDRAVDVVRKHRDWTLRRAAQANVDRLVRLFVEGDTQAARRAADLLNRYADDLDALHRPAVDTSGPAVDLDAEPRP